MAEEKKEPWLNYLAMSTVIFAVLATLSTFKGGGYSTRAVLLQSQASDKWAHYQSKSIKGYIKELQKDKYDTELRFSSSRLTDEGRDYYAKQMTAAEEKIKAYEQDKAEIMAEARSLEKQRDESQLHQKGFGMAIIFLQIAVLLGSIAALLKKKPIWFLSLLIGVIGILYFMSGFMLFLPA